MEWAPLGPASREPDSGRPPKDGVVHPLLFDVRSGVVEPLGPA